MGQAPIVYRTRYWSPLYDTIVPLNDSSSCVISLLHRLASISASSARCVSAAVVSSGSRDGLVSAIPALTVTFGDSLRSLRLLDRSGKSTFHTFPCSILAMVEPMD